jgi:CRISPR/Cas system-associated protein Csm6
MLPWWIIVPPVGMLGLLMLVLREAARADAEAAERAAEAHAAHEARLAERRRASEAAAVAPEPTAEIIDISARVGDQLYDQYADAAVRAVGD